MPGAFTMSQDLTPKICVELACVTSMPKHIILSAQPSSPLFHPVKCCPVGHLCPWVSMTVRILLLTYMAHGAYAGKQSWLFSHREFRGLCYQYNLAYSGWDSQPWAALCMLLPAHVTAFLRNECLLQSQNIKLLLKHLCIHQAPTFCPSAPLHLLTLDAFLLFIHGLLNKCLPQTNQELPWVCQLFWPSLCC